MGRGLNEKKCPASYTADDKNGFYSMNILNSSAALDFARNRYRGALVAIIGGISAMWLSEHYQTPAMLMALLLGLALHFLHDDERIAVGIDWAAGDLLRIGVALLGFRVAMGDIVAGGYGGPLIVVAAMAGTFLFGAIAARFLNLTSDFSRLSAGSVAICGVSAAIAIASVLPKRDGDDEELAVVIIAVTALSTIAMIFYPIISAAFSFDAQMAGIFIGGSIHDVAQVIGAGYTISDEAGDTATYIKLMRVALLLPIVLIIGAASQKLKNAQKGMRGLIPNFLILFVIFAMANSFGWVNQTIIDVGSDLSRALLIVAIFAIGAKSQLKDILSIGPRPFMLICAQTIIMALIVIGGLVLFMG